MDFGFWAGILSIDSNAVGLVGHMLGMLKKS